MNQPDRFNLTWLNSESWTWQYRIRQEMAKIGANQYARNYMAPKGDFYVFRAENLSNAGANILKQEFLAKGAEAVVHPMVIVAKVPYSSVIMFATKRQYQQIIEKFSKQQFGLPELGKELAQALDNIAIASWDIPCGDKILRLGNHTIIMGILNITPDSFSDGGNYNSLDAALAQARAMVMAGAKIIDVGGESTRPGYQPVTIAEEIARVVPVIKQIKAELDVLISVDTFKPEVAEAAIEAGAHIINDIWGLQSPQDQAGNMARIAAKYGVLVIAMHNQEGTAYGNKNQRYLEQGTPEIQGDLMGDMGRFFRRTIDIATGAGLSSELLIFDMGFGFGKTRQHNLEGLSKMSALKILGRPLLLGASRKSTIGKILDKDVDERIFGTAATTALGVGAGAAIIRVHDVAEMLDVVKISDAIYENLKGEQHNE